jgi:hypothetical protein
VTKIQFKAWTASDPSNNVQTGTGTYLMRIRKMWLNSEAAYTSPSIHKVRNVWSFASKTPIRFQGVVITYGWDF